MIVVAPASSALSTSSLTTETGRSITSPAAIRSAISGGSTRIIGRRGSMGSAFTNAPIIPSNLAFCQRGYVHARAGQVRHPVAPRQGLAGGGLQLVEQG